MTETVLREGERIDETGFGDVRLIQDAQGFRYGIDAVLLADFAHSHAADTMHVTELGSGNGIVSFLLAEKSPSRMVTGVDFQETAVDLATRSSVLNDMTERVSFTHCDIMALKEEHPQWQKQMDLVVTNPPYVARNSGLSGSSPRVHAARQETTATMEDFIRTAAWLFKEHGHFCMVHRPARLVDMICFCRQYRLEPKNIRLVAPRNGEPPNIVLLHCVLGGGVELRYDNILYVYREEGGYSENLLRIYGRE